MLTRCAVLAASLLLLLSFATAGDVPSQRIDAAYDPDDRAIRGHVDVTLDATTETVYFLLLPNLASEPNPYLSDRNLDAEYPFGFEPAELAIESVALVQSSSEDALAFRLLAAPPVFQTYALDEAILAVDLPPGIDRPTLRIAFETEAPRRSAGDEGLTEGVLTWRFGWYPLLLAEQARIVEKDGIVGYGEDKAFPLVFRRTELAAAVSTPAEMVFLSGADRIESENASEVGDRTVHRAEYASPTGSFALALGAGYAVYRLGGPIPIEVAYFEGHESSARLFATYAREILARYEERFGPYPRERLTIVENPNEAGAAFAADGILWLSSLYFTHRNIPLAGIGDRLAEFVLAHELAHQWFGLGRSVDLDAEAWLSEGLAQYAAISDYELRHGPTGGNLFGIASQGLLEELVDRQFGFYNLREHQIELPYLLNLWSGFDEALVKPTRDVEFANADVVRLYNKGYLVARAIAADVGGVAFDRALRAALQASAGGRLTVSRVQRALEEEAGRPLDELLSVWLFDEGAVDYAATIASSRRTENGYETAVTVTRDGGTPQPVEVEVTLRSGATDRKTWTGEGNEGRLVFSTPSPVRRATIDPDHRLPDRNRLNNNDPTKIVTAINRSALPLDAYLLSPNPTTGGFTFGWLDRFLVTIGEQAASMIVREGRHHEYSASVSIEDDRLTGIAAYAYTRYHQPETGSPATYWEPDVELTFGARRIAAGDESIWSVGLTAYDYPSIGDSGARSVGFDVSEGGAVRLALAAFDETRILPQLYLQGIGSLAFSVGDLPTPLRFSFDELRSDRLGRTPNKLTGTIALDLTTVAEPYNVANLAIVDRNVTRLFLAGGLGWTSLRDFGTTDLFVEAGIEQVVGLSTLGGLLPFSVRVGIVTPVVGPGATVLYAGISL